MFYLSLISFLFRLSIMYRKFCQIVIKYRTFIFLIQFADSKRHNTLKLRQQRKAGNEYNNKNYCHKNSHYHPLALHSHHGIRCGSKIFLSQYLFNHLPIVHLNLQLREVTEYISPGVTSVVSCTSFEYFDRSYVWYNFVILVKLSNMIQN